jgi:AraC-like DNA-binding protein
MMIFYRLKFIIFIFFSIFCFGQQELNAEKSKTFQHYKTLVNTTMKEYALNSEELLKNAQSAEEKSFANYIVGSSRYRDGLYLQAVNYYEKAEEYGNTSNSTETQLGYINGLVMAYRRAGLVEQSNDAWERYKKLSNKSNNPYKEAEYYYNISKIYDIDEDYCKASEARKKYLSLVPLDIQKKDPDYIFAVYAQNAFTQMKCGKPDEAAQSIKKADETIAKIPEKTNSSLYEIYELASAMLALKKGENRQAKELFTNAYIKSKEKNTIAATKLILNERLSAKTDSPEEQLYLLKEVNEITKKETLNTQKLTKYETLKSKKKIQKEKKKTTFWLTISAVSLIGIISLFRYNRQKNKKIRIAYEKIIEDLDKKNHPKNEVQMINSDETNELENEDKIVKRLETLEQKYFFTTQNMSAAQMAVLLKITPRNLSYLLKKYRDEDFYNYLNNVRIDYFSKILRENPKYRNYKIAALSEKIGYSSHSQLTINFKKKTGITPSQYIDLLEKEEVLK